MIMWRCLLLALLQFRQITTNDARLRKSLAHFTAPAPGAATYVQDITWLLQWSKVVSLQKIAEDKMLKIQAADLSHILGQHIGRIFQDPASINESKWVLQRGYTSKERLFLFLQLFLHFTIPGKPAQYTHIITSLQKWGRSVRGCFS